MTAPVKAFLVSHTHWDREWYRTFHDFRTSLVDVVGGVLRALESDDSFRHFLLDGQSVILEDYLEVVPEDEERIARLVKSGALAVGPWYVLPDGFLVSAEAHVRNLLHGSIAANRVGGVQEVGYMPDSFGHPAQMPQILRQAGIDTFVYTRGDGDDLDRTGTEYTWRAPDGSEVLAVHQQGGYCAASALGLEELWHVHTQRAVDPGRAVTKVAALFDAMAERSDATVRLLSNGCDHAPAPRDFERVLTALRAAFPRTQIVHGSLEEYLTELRDGGFGSRVREGALTWGKHHHILTGVWSARTYLKQQNDRAQVALTREAEPVAAYAHFMHGAPYPAGLLTYGWRLLLKNHPHDSICGCSIDAVHREMIPRFDGAVQTAEAIVTRHLERLTPTFARDPAQDCRTAMAVMNPLPFPRSAIVERLIVIAPPGLDPAAATLFDGEGRTVPFEVVGHWVAERFWGVDYRKATRAQEPLGRFACYRRDLGVRILRDASKRDSGDTFLHVRFLARDIPGVGHRTYYLHAAHDRAGSSSLPDPVRLRGHTLENGRLRVRLHGDGRFDVDDLATGRSFPGLGALIDVADVGDEYDFAPAAEILATTSHGASGSFEVVEDGPLRGTVAVAFTMRLPDGIEASRQRRTAATMACPVRVQVTLEAGQPWVDLRIDVENCAKDHRLRASFPTGIQGHEVLCHGHFHVDRNPVQQPAGHDWVQPPSGAYPQQDFSVVQDEEGGIALLARGLHELAPRHEADGSVTLDLTLLRCVGWLSRDDLVTRRRQNAGPTMATPDAQCLGSHTYEIALVPFEGSWLAAGVAKTSDAWRVPPLSIQGVEDGHIPGGPGLLEVKGDGVAVTAVKRHESKDSLVIRMYGLGGDACQAALVLGRTPVAAWVVDLLEERREELDVVGSSVTVAIGAHRIVTVEVAFA